jgi:P-type Ca2+ transporter type 2C
VLNHSNAENHTECNNILFVTLIVTQLLHAFNMNSAGSTFFRSEVFKNKFLWYALIISFGIMLVLYFIPTVREVLSVSILSLNDLIIIVGSSMLSLVFIQFAKSLRWVEQ